MNFRNALLLFSVTMLGFCLTLYFQSENSFQSINIEQYKNLQYNEARSHPLEEFNQKIAPLRLDDIVQDLAEKNRLAGVKTRVMEIGFGNGRVLMELKKKFPQVEFYGINKEKTHTFYRRESFILTALKFNIMNKEEAENMTLPYVVFQDLDFGRSIPYDDNKFDLIFSQSTIPHIRYTFEMFNEILRVLKQGGISLHSDVTGVNIFSKNSLLTLAEAASEMRKKGLEINVLDKPTSVRFIKTSSQKSFPLTPHQPIPTQTEGLSSELRRPEMSYNFNNE
jgi:ubiquinone/menaquinone biosynthesis C-methylase UbiE